VLTVVFGLWLLLSACACEPDPGPEPEFRALTSTTFYGRVADGYIRGKDPVYSVARSTSAACVTDTVEIQAGQYKIAGGQYWIWRGYLAFDTSALPDDAVVSSAVLYLYGQTDNSAGDFDVSVYRRVWTLDLCSAQEANYDLAYDGTAVDEGILVNTSSFTTAGYMTMTVATAGISKTGTTYYTVVSDEDAVGSTPPNGVREDVMFYSTEEAGDTKDPKLVIEWAVPTPTPTNTPTDTPAPTSTLTRTPTPTVTAICPAAILDDTSWGPGTVRVSCNVGVATNTVLTITAGTNVVFVGDHKMDVQGELYAVGTASQPITFSHSSAVTKSSWSYIHLSGPTASTLDYCVIKYGRGINDEAGSTIRHTEVMTCEYGLATMSDTDVISCTFQYNTYGVLPYLECQPTIRYCNILGNTWDVWVDQITSLAMPHVWWGGDPPDLDLVWDYADDIVLGATDTSASSSSWIAW